MDKKGSILIWTMFVSLFIASFFVAYQRGFLNYAKTSQVEQDRIESDIKLEEALDSLKEKPIATTDLGKYELISQTQTGTKEIISIGTDESAEFKIMDIGATTSINAEVPLGGPYSYQVIPYIYGDEAAATVFDSGIISEGGIAVLHLDNSKDFNIIGVRNLGGLGELRIDRGTTDLRQSTSVYSLYEKYSTWKRFVRNISVKNFDRWSTGLNYNGFQIFLKSTNYGE